MTYSTKKFDRGCGVRMRQGDVATSEEVARASAQGAVRSQCELRSVRGEGLQQRARAVVCGA